MTTTTVAVIGLGYVGLPLVVEFGKQIRTIGFDISTHKVQACQRGTDPSRELTDEQVQAASLAVYTDDPKLLGEAGHLAENRPADVLGDAGVDGRLVHDDAALLQGLAHRVRGADDGRQVGHVVVVDGRGHGDHEERHALEICDVRGDLERRLLEHLLGDLVVAVVAALELGDLGLVDVEPDRAGELAGKGQGDWQTDVPETNDGNAFAHGRRVYVSGRCRPSVLSQKCAVAPRPWMGPDGEVEECEYSTYSSHEQRSQRGPAAAECRRISDSGHHPKGRAVGGAWRRSRVRAGASVACLVERVLAHSSGAFAHLDAMR